MPIKPSSNYLSKRPLPSIVLDCGWQQDEFACDLAARPERTGSVLCFGGWSGVLSAWQCWLPLLASDNMQTYSSFLSCWIFSRKFSESWARHVSRSVLRGVSFSCRAILALKQIAEALESGANSHPGGSDFSFFPLHIQLFCLTPSPRESYFFRLILKLRDNSFVWTSSPPLLLLSIEFL